MPTISVLMGIYNCERTLRDAVQSIQKQTITDWELIMCDDGSADATYELAQLLASTDKRLRVIKNEHNMGLAAALNHCLKYADGIYIARMDGDDICDPLRFKKELQYLKTNPKTAVVSCGMFFYDESGVYGRTLYREYPKKEDLIYGSPFCHAGCMMRKEVLIRLGGYNDSQAVNRMEDYDLWFRLYQAGYTGYNIPEYLYSMRDDRAAYKRRKFRYRIQSTKLKWNIYREFHLGIGKLPYVVAPVIKGILPRGLYQYVHRKKLQQ